MQNLSDLLGLNRDKSVLTRKIFKMKSEDIENSSKLKNRKWSQKNSQIFSFLEPRMARVSEFYVKF